MSCPQSFEQVYFTSYNGKYAIFFVRQRQPFDIQWFLFMAILMLIMWQRYEKFFDCASIFAKKFSWRSDMDG